MKYLFEYEVSVCGNRAKREVSDESIKADIGRLPFGCFRCVLGTYFFRKGNGYHFLPDSPAPPMTADEAFDVAVKSAKAAGNLKEVAGG